MSKELRPLKPNFVEHSTHLVPVERQVERLRSLRDLVNSIYRQTQDIREIYLYNYNRGIKWEERDAYEHPIDYKLNQLEHWLVALKGMVGADLPDIAASFDMDIEVERKRLT